MTMFFFSSTSRSGIAHASSAIVWALAASSAAAFSTKSAFRIASTSLSATASNGMPNFTSRQDYLAHLETISQLPQGFATGTAEGTFIPADVPSMGNLGIRGTVIRLTDGPTSNWAAVFTKNKFPGAPIKVGRSRLAGGGPLDAIVINNKVSNVCSGGDGVADAETVCDAVASALGLSDSSTVLPSSTGVIGWRLPAKVLAEQVVPKAVENLQTKTALDAAAAICTTDRYPKVRSKVLSNGARIVGIAKGAGMIEPNMATMLGYIMTDATMPKETLQSILSEAVDESFNSISVDGAESTSDTVVLLASNKVPEGDEAEFRDAVMEVCRDLSGDIVRNGEGTAHVMRVKVTNYPGTDQDARNLGRHIVNSPLFKTAVNGNDPNTGRLAGAIGSFMGREASDPSTDGMSLTLGGRTIFSNGKFVIEGDDVELELSKHMKEAGFGDNEDFPSHQLYVEIGVDFGAGGSGTATVLGSDLSAEYVSINADYRS